MSKYAAYLFRLTQICVSLKHIQIISFQVFDGIPTPYDKQKRMVVPSALRVLKLKPGRKYCKIGRLSHETGWKYKPVIDALEEKRKAKDKVYYAAKMKALRLKRQAEKQLDAQA